MKRGDVWVAVRAGHERLVVIVGHDAVTAAREAVLVVPISDVRAATLIEPRLHDQNGQPLGVAMTPRVGEITKAYLNTQRTALDPASRESLDIALRAVLDL